MIDDATPTQDTLPIDPTTMGAVGSAGPRVVGRFTVLGVLGHGAMGVVLAAYDPDLDRKVALKLLRSDGVAQATERMLREARAMAKLSHPNVLAIHEVGSVDGRVFLAMEYAAGGTLRAWCAAEKRPWPDVLAKFLEVGRGLAAAHDAGLVHRDFKPGNVLLDKGGGARVADFGLVGVYAERAGADDAVRERDLTLTQTGAVLGTPAYMAPEQHEHASVGPAADQFAFCVSLWEALYGLPPFEGETVRTLRDNVCANRVVSPPATSDVPAWVGTALRRGLSQAPEARWPSMHALLAVLGADVDGARRRTRWMIGGAFAAVVVAGGAALAVQREHGGPSCSDMGRSLAGVWDPARSDALRAAFRATGRGDADDIHARVAKGLDAYTTSWVVVRRARCEATHVHGDQSAAMLDLAMACLDRKRTAVDALVDQLAVATPEVLDRAIAATTRLPPLAECTDAAALRASIAGPDDAATSAQIESVRTELAVVKALADTGQYKPARARANEIAERTAASPYAQLRAEALHRRGVMERLDGDAEAAMRSFDAALRAAADARDDRLTVEAWNDIIYTLGELQQKSSEALALRPAAEVALRRAGNDPILAGNQLANLGRVLMNDGKFAAARQALEQAIVLKERTVGKDSFDVARALTSLGNVLYELGEYEDALAVHTRALAIWSATFGPDHPDVLAVETNIANVYHSTGNYAEARKRYERVRDGAVRTLGPDHHRVADIEMNLANSLRELDDLDGAVAGYHRALSILGKAFGEPHSDIARTHVDLGRLYLDFDRLTDAEATYRRALAMYAQLPDEVGSNEASFGHEGLAEVLIRTKRASEAVTAAERAVAIRDANEIEPEMRSVARLVLGHALLAAGRDRERALRLVTDARAALVPLGDMSRARVAQAEAILARYKR